MAKYRIELKKALALERTIVAIGGVVAESHQAHIEYLNDKIAAFEERESEAKRFAWELLIKDRRGRR